MVAEDIVWSWGDSRRCRGAAAGGGGPEAEWRARRRRSGGAGEPALDHPRPARRAPAASAQSTATRRPGDSCSVHSVTFSTLSRALCAVVSTAFSDRSIPHPVAAAKLPDALRSFPARSFQLSHSSKLGSSREAIRVPALQADRSASVVGKCWVRLSRGGSAGRRRGCRRTVGVGRTCGREKVPRPPWGRRHAVPTAARLRVLRDAVRLLPAAVPAAGAASPTAAAAAASPAASSYPDPLLSRYPTS